MSIESRVRAVEKVVDVTESERRDYTLEQILTVVRMIRSGASRRDAWASVGPPRVVLRAGEPTLAELAISARQRSAVLTPPTQAARSKEEPLDQRPQSGSRDEPPRRG